MTKVVYGYTRALDWQLGGVYFYSDKITDVTASLWFAIRLNFDRIDEA